MCFFSPPPMPSIKTAVAPAPQRNSSSGLATFARMQAANAKGAIETTATSPLGDLGFGSNVKKPTVLGSVGATGYA